LRVSEATIHVRISAASPEADLAAAVWPGVASVIYPRVETARQIEEADACVARLERLRGIRPGSIEIQPLIESTRGVTHAPGIASSSPRIGAMGLGPAITLEVGDEALNYARSECELHSRACGIVPLDPFVPHD
jgi:citrate lyase subunit beta/citryl-CoA lyase